MIYRFETLVRRLRRWLSRSEWAVRLFRMPRPAAMQPGRGLLIVQIDGLSRAQLENALGEGKMPFLRRLLHRERYRLHTLYSGVPSGTPAVQAELFYGVKGAIPAFGFRDSATGQIVRMVEPAPVKAAEQRLEALGAPLLADGAAYFDIFTGGARERHFCPSSVGWGPFLRGANPFALAFLFVTNAYSALRLAVLLLVELAIAFYDFLTGVIAGRNFLAELKFVPTRTAISILLRELVRIGAEIDAARGLPVIHANFVGYDEQAHRRGPNSAFARWTLKGIDDAVSRLWNAAKRSGRREYDVWVYSDHGQEETQAYPELFGRTVEDAVAGVFDELQHVRTAGAHGLRGIESQRVAVLGGRKSARLFPVYRDSAPPAGDADKVTVVAMGPLGFIYAPRPLTTEGRAEIAHRLVAECGIPLVLAADGPDDARAWTKEGELLLPDEGAALLGADHPFAEEAIWDLIALCAHPDSGDLVIGGWRKGEAPLSFRRENGAHAGPGPEETRAFALLPPDTPVARVTRPYLRPLDLRHAALELLGRSQPGRAAVSGTAPGGRRREADVLRLMTYNVHSCIGMDGRSSPERIARVIAEYEPDIVALQELDVGRGRTGSVDQAQEIAHMLEMEYRFHATVCVAEEQYGNAILTHLPMRVVHADSLPGLPQHEPRGALWVAVATHGGEIQVLNTHLSVRPKERSLQAAALLGGQWLGHLDCRRPAILLGDLNATPGSTAYRMLRDRLRDAQSAAPEHRPRNTLFSRYPSARIDHVFLDPALEILDAEVPRTQLSTIASDHLPLIVDVRVAGTRAAAQGLRDEFTASSNSGMHLSVGRTGTAVRP